MLNEVARVLRTAPAHRSRPPPVFSSLLPFGPWQARHFLRTTLGLHNLINPFPNLARCLSICLSVCLSVCRCCSPLHQRSKAVLDTVTYVTNGQWQCHQGQQQVLADDIKWLMWQDEYLCHLQVSTTSWTAEVASRGTTPLLLILPAHAHPIRCH